MLPKVVDLYCIKCERHQKVVKAKQYSDSIKVILGCHHQTELTLLALAVGLEE